MKRDFLLQYDSEDGYIYDANGMMIYFAGGNDGTALNVAEFSMPAQPAPVAIEKEVEKIVYRDAPEQKTPPETIASLPKVQNGVSDLISLKEAGFSVTEILELRAEHLI